VHRPAVDDLHDVAAQVEFESKALKHFIVSFTSRRFQYGFDRVNLHRLTMSSRVCSMLMEYVM